MGQVVFSSEYSHSGIGYSKCNVRITFSESYNQTNNTTTITITNVELQREGNGINWGNMPFYGSITINGTTIVSFNGGSSYVSLSSGAYTPVYGMSSGSITVTHEDDGSKSVTFGVVGGIYKEGQYFFCGYYNGQYVFGVTTQTAQVNLTTRPRISLVSATDAYFGGISTITISRYNNSFTHTVVTSCAGITDTLMTKGASTSLSWSPSVATYATAITNAMNATATIICDTYNGDTLIGTSTTTCLLAFRPQDVAPSVAITVSDPTGCLGAYGKFVKSKSRISVGLTTTMAYGASLVTQNITANGATYNTSPITTDVIMSTSNTTVSATIVDSRGQTASNTVTIQILDYNPPRINGFSVHRCNVDGTSNNAGGYMAITYDVVITSLEAQNSKTAVVKYKKFNDSIYSQQAITISGYTASGTLAPLEDSNNNPIQVDVNSTYNIQFILTDSFGSASFATVLPTASTRMNWGAGENGGIAVGKVSEFAKTFEIADDWTLKSKSLDDQIETTVDSLIVSFTTVTVLTSAFLSDSTYTDYGYRAAIPLTGVQSSMIPDVVFGVDEATSGEYAPICESYNGGVYIYSKSVPSSDITIPIIYCIGRPT